VTGVPRTCRHADGDRDEDDLAKMHVTVRDSQPLRATTVTLDGRRIKSITRSSFALTVDLAKVKLGRHKLVVTATNTAGGRATRTVTLTRCPADHHSHEARARR
jgi:hypothetical protein